ncbi:MAG TPA: uroporphyrinogen decarboxylase family protein [Armatimonadota bacterium]|jgi:uroporphyrinogen decarboxylase
MHFVAAIYEHAAQLMGATPWAVSRDGDLLARAHGAAFRRYGHAPVVVGIDVYHVEAEAAGATVVDMEGTPHLAGHPFTAVGELLALPPLDAARDGRLPLVLDAGSRLHDEFPLADIRIPVTGPFTLAAMLLGLDNLLCDLLTEPEEVGAALQFLAERQRGWLRAIAARGLGMVVFESAAAPPMVSPQSFSDTLLPALHTLLAGVAALTGEGAMLIQGGDTAPIAEALCTLPVAHVLCPAETDAHAFLAPWATRPEVTVRLNLPAGVIASPHWSVIQPALDRLRTLASGRAAVCLGTGVVPYDTPPDNLLRAQAYLRG